MNVSVHVVLGPDPGLDTVQEVHTARPQPLQSTVRLYQYNTGVQSAYISEVHVYRAGYQSVVQVYRTSYNIAVQVYRTGYLSPFCRGRRSPGAACA